MEMKKLFVFFALALACAGANAASVNWKVSGDAATANNKVYLVGALSDAWTSVADIATDSAAFGTEGTSGTIVRQGRTYYTSGTLASDNVTKMSGDVYVIIVSGDDAKSYTYNKVDWSGLTYEGTETPPGQYVATANDLISGGTTVAFVPEPTSGLLMLVGLAGLALRRRRA